LSLIVAVYDTQAIHHLLTGETFITLEDLASKYGLTKMDTIKGKDTSEVLMGELVEYCKNDVDITMKVFLEQRKSMTAIQWTYANIQSRTTIALFEMELNGLHVDKERLRTLYSDVESKLKVAEEGMKRSAVEISKRTIRFRTSCVPSKDPFADVMANPSTTRSLNVLLLGKQVPVEYMQADGVYKNGKPKFKRCRTTATISMIASLTVLGISAMEIPNPHLGFTMDVKRLESLAIMFKTFGCKDHVELIEHVLAYRKLSKIKETYLDSLGKMLEDLDPEVIHQTLNQAATATGRLSATSPNTQNQPEIVKQIYTNRYNKDYGIISADFKQLEVMAAAYLSGDPQLLQDIQDKVDIHAEVGKQAGLPLAKDRRTVKGVVFGTIYGGGANRLAEQSGLPKMMVKNIQAAFFNRYPTLKEYYDNLKTKIKATKPVSVVAKDEQVFRLYKWYSATGRSYWFQEYQSTWGYKGAAIDISHTEVCNYPIQGWATGDLVPAYLGLLRAYQRYYDSGGLLDGVIFTNTIHDSIEAEGNFPAESESNTNARLIMEILAGEVLCKLYKAWTGDTMPFELQLETTTKLPKELELC
jgi:hypothetical protein